MIRYYTEFEQELMSHVEDLKRHIAERDEHLKKANGYAPAGPVKIEKPNRSEFVAKLLPVSSILEKWDVQRSYSPGEKEKWLIFTRKGQKPNISDDIYISFPMARLLYDRIGMDLYAEVVQRWHNSDQRVRIKDLQLLPVDFFEYVKPASLPEFDWVVDRYDI